MTSSGDKSETRQVPVTPDDPILARLMDERAIERALQRAVREALVRHKKLGESVAMWQDGRAVVLPPESIPY